MSTVEQLQAALAEALDGWEDASQYKGEYLAAKHGDAEDIARLRALLPASLIAANHNGQCTCAACTEVYR